MTNAVYDEIRLNLRRRRPYFDLIRKDNEKAKIKRKLTQFNTYLNSYGLNFKSIDITRMTDNKNFSLNIEENYVVNDKAAICQTARDVALMSERSYCKFRKTLKPIAKLISISKCNQFKLRVNNFWPISNNTSGAYIDEPSLKIKYICQKFLNINQNQSEERKFKILLSGDGINITKTHLSVLNFTFRLLNDSDISLNSCYTLGIFKIEFENYATIKKCLQELTQKLSILDEIQIENRNYEIEFFMGGDLKWLSAINGINAANSKFPCPWCLWKNEEIEISGINLDNFLNLNWSLNGRTHEAANEALKSKQQDIDTRKGYQNKPLFPFIEFNKCVVDVLHLTLRITDKLFFLLMSRLDELEGNDSVDITNKNLSKIFKDFVEIECNITHPFYFEKEKNKLKMRNLNQNERIKIIEKMFENRSLTSIFPKRFERDIVILRLNRIFNNFLKIFYLIKKDYTKELYDRKKLEDMLKIFLKDYIQIIPSKQITPYIHILCFHVPELIEKHKNLNLFSMQALEKLNNFDKINYFRQTNHQKNHFPSTLLEKMNRLELIHLNGRLSENLE